MKRLLALLLCAAILLSCAPFAFAEGAQGAAEQAVSAPSDAADSLPAADADTEISPEESFHPSASHEGEADSDSELPAELPEAEEHPIDDAVAALPEDDADVLSEAEAEEPALGEDAPRFDTEEAAAKYLRDALRNRESSVTFFCAAPCDDALAGRLLDMALVHTGDPNEGDSLREFQDATATFFAVPGGTQLTYTFVHRTTYEQEQELNAEITAVLDSLHLEEKGEYEKLRAIYDFICAHVAYDNEHLYDDAYQLKYTAYAAMMQGTAVCNGYTLLLYRMLLEADIDCRYITGNIPTEENDKHAWCIVLFNGAYYYVDPTWDAGQTIPIWFLKSEADFAANHVPDELYTTEEFRTLYPVSETSYTPETNELIDSGVCGANASWEIYQDGSLVIRGSGAIDDYTYAADVPWYAYRASVRSLSISETITRIGMNAFAECVNLLTVSIPDSVTELGDLAFNNCLALTNVEIGSGLVGTYGSTFFFCTALQSFSVSAENPNLRAIDGVLFSHDNTLLVYPAGRGGTYAIPEGTAAISDYAFYCAEQLNEITIPDTVTSVGAYAFGECTALASVHIGSGLTPEQLSSDAFCGNTALQSFSVSAENPVFYTANGVLFSRDGVLRAYPAGRSGDYTIPEETTTIAPFAFCNVQGLTTLTIPLSVTAIRSFAFSAANLSTVCYMGNENQWKTQVEIGEAENDALRNATIQYLGPLVPVIARGKCGANLSWALDADGTLVISGTGDMTSYDFSGSPWSYDGRILSVIVEDGVTSIGANAFRGCASLTTVLFGNSVARIENAAFTECAALQSAPLPDSLTAIGSRAFENCTALTTFTVPAGVTSMDGSAIRGCSGITAFSVAASNSAFTVSGGVLFSASMHELVAYPGGKIGAYTVPNGVTRIGFEAFFSCAGLTSITLPDTVHEIGEYAFYACKQLTTVSIPEGVTAIQNGVFSDCFGLTEIRLPATLTHFYPDAFASCNAIAHVYFSGTKAQWDSIINMGSGNEAIYNAVIHYSDVETVIDGGACGAFLLWAFGDKGTLTVFGLGSMTDYPAKENAPWHQYRNSILTIYIDNGVGSIASHAFEACFSVTALTIPDSVTAIGESAFANCTSLTHVEIGSGLKDLYPSTFAFCRSLQSFTVSPNNETFTTDAAGALLAAHTLIAYPAGREGAYEIPNDVQTVCSYAFGGVSHMPTLKIPSSVTTIQEYAFDAATGIATVRYHGKAAGWNRISIGANNDALLSATRIYLGLPIDSGSCGANVAWSFDDDGVLAITGTGAMDSTYQALVDVPWYRYCDQILSVSIAEGVTTIGSLAFYRCSKLTTISIPNSVTAIGQFSISDCAMLEQITIGSGLGTDFYPNSFRDLPALQRFVVSANNKTLAAQDGVLYTRDGATLLLYPSGRTGAYEIPNGTTMIGAYAFYGISRLTTLTIPISVTEIQSRAFDGATGITTVRYRGNVNLWGKISIGANNDALINAPRIYLGSSVIILYQGKCGANLTWTLDDAGRLTISGTGAMTEYTSSASIPWNDYRDEIRAVSIAEGPTSISHFAFYSCNALTALSLPNSVTAIGQFSISDCAMLEQITIGSGLGTDFYPNSFRDLPALQRFAVSANNATLSAQDGVLLSATAHILIAYPAARAGDYTIPDGIQTILSNAFCGAGKLQTLTIPSSVTQIAESAFTGANGLKTVRYQGKQAGWDRITIGANNDALLTAALQFLGLPLNSGKCGENLTWAFDDEGTLTISGTGAMTTYGSSGAVPWNAYRSSVRSVSIAEGVTTISHLAFYGCSILKTIAIPDSVTTIGQYSISYCASLTHIYIGSGLQSWQTNTFENCPSLVQFTVSDAHTALVAQDGVLLYPAGHLLIAYPAARAGNYTIPDGIQTIQQDAFYGARNIRRLGVPVSVKTIGTNAFANVSGLTDVDYGGESAQWQAIMRSTGNDALTKATVHFPTDLVKAGTCGDTVWALSKTGTLTISGAGATAQFSNDTAAPWSAYRDSIVNVVIADDVLAVYNRAFVNCANLQHVTIGSSLKVFGSFAVMNCHALESITVSEANPYFESIDGVLFTRNPRKLQTYPIGRSGSYAIPDGTTEIGAQAFLYIRKLSVLTIPASVTAIGMQAFTGASGITRVIYFGTQEQWDDMTIASGAITSTMLSVLAYHPNHTYKWDFHPAPTCTSSGEVTYTCTICGESYSETLAALGHDLTHHDAKAATCTEGGWAAYDTCSRCDYTTYTEIAALGHDLAHHDAKAATCTEGGWAAYDTCSRCDYTTYTEIAALGHDLTHHDAKAATCIEGGWNAYDTCSRCDYSTYTEIAALGHDLVHHDAQAATCTEIGWNAYDTCSRCDYTTYTEIAALGHEWSAKKLVITEASEAGPGLKAYVCAHCDARKGEEEIPYVAYKVGDANSDGFVTGKDVTAIRRHIAGGYNVTINEAAADVNHDGVVTGKDVTAIRRAIAGGYGIELR